MNLSSPWEDESTWRKAQGTSRFETASLSTIAAPSVHSSRLSAVAHVLCNLKQNLNVTSSLSLPTNESNLVSGCHLFQAPGVSQRNTNAGGTHKAESYDFLAPLPVTSRGTGKSPWDNEYATLSFFHSNGMRSFRYATWQSAQQESQRASRLVPKLERQRICWRFDKNAHIWYSGLEK